VTVSFVKSLSLYVRPHETSGLPLGGFSWNLSIFRKSFRKLKFLLKSDKNNGYWTWILIYIFDRMSLISS
jgi:hypothetical protein